MKLLSPYVDALRNVVPFSAWQTGGFVRRLPSYWRLDRSNALRIRHRIGGLPHYITKDIYVLSPESVTAFIDWQIHGVEINESSAEVTDFLELSKGCRALVDIGAQTGFMSALFARSRSGAGQILSVEPDPQVLPILRRAMELNCRTEIDWKVAATAVSDSSGRLTLPVSNSLYESREKKIEIDVPVTTLTEILSNLNWQPDIIKIDVESFEHELICSSLDLIDRLKPKLQLEVHWKMLEQRGRNAKDFLAPLEAFGYRGIRGRYRDLGKWLQLKKSEAVSRFALSP